MGGDPGPLSERDRALCAGELDLWKK
jgi:hypothetical protein